MSYLSSMPRILLAGVLLGSLTACGGDKHAHDEHKHEHKHEQAHGHEIEIHHPRVHPTVEGIKVTGVYFDLFNGKHEDIKLVKVTGDISGRIEVHEHAMEDGLMKMREVDNGIALPSGQMVVFKPHGYHVMLMDLEKVINEGDTVDLELHFDNGESKKISAKALKPSAKQHSHHHY